MLNLAPTGNAPAADVRPRPLDIVVDGTENENGRALFVISALHLAAGALNPARIWVLAPCQPVSVAAEALAWDAHLNVTCLPADPDFEIVKSSDLVLTASSFEPNWPFLIVAYRAGIKAVSVVQFPRLAPELNAHFPHIRAAHDTTVLAARIAEELAVLRP